MKDRFKFRGQDLNTGEWIEGDIIARSEEHTYIGQLEFPKYDYESIGCGVEDMGCSDRYEGADYGYALCDGEMLQNVIACNPETIGQYTGLKDKNGALIFEGDILTYKGTKKITIEWCTDTASFMIFGGADWPVFIRHNKPKDFEVIGNIHEEAANE